MNPRLPVILAFAIPGSAGGGPRRIPRAVLLGRLRDDGLAG
jgi:hypothetical protein